MIRSASCSEKQIGFDKERDSHRCLRFYSKIFLLVCLKGGDGDLGLGIGVAQEHDVGIVNNLEYASRSAASGGLENISL